MSIERPVNGPCRSASTNFGRIGRFGQFLERRVEPLDVPDLERHARAFAASAIRSSASATVRQTGFSTRTGHAGLEERGRDRVVVDGRRDDADGVDARRAAARSESNGVVPSRAAMSRACSGLASTTPTSSTSGMPARMRAWCWPRCPTPITAIRKRVISIPSLKSSSHQVVRSSSRGHWPRRLAST